jgi:23S rRNA (cytosine1962-C5)-methyltransferase
MKRLKLTPETVGPVARGHPWVYAGGVEGSASAGTPIQLMDGRNRPVGWGLADEGAIAIRVLGRHPEPLPGLLETRIKHALELRSRLIPSDTNAFRLVNGAGDGLPGLVIDRYDRVLVLRVYSKAWEPHLSAVVDALRTSAECQSILRKFGVRNVDGRQGGELLHGEELPTRLLIQENGLCFRVRPIQGQKTGLFLDQRENRAHLGRMATGLDVANLFAYNGGFSVYAAAAGARQVLSVDISAAAIEDAKENFRLNGLDPGDHRFLATDAFHWTPEGDGRPDLLIYDPPSLARGKRSDTAARKSYRELASRCGSHLGSQGLLASFSCTARLDHTRWMQAVREGLRKSGRWSLLWQASEPPDHPVALEHPEGRYLKFALFRRA